MIFPKITNHAKLAILLLSLTGTAAIAIDIFYFSSPDAALKNPPVQIGNCKDSVVTAVVNSIQKNPTNWESDNFKMWHDEGVSVWIANEDYGLSISMGKNARPDQYKMDDECRALLYDATQRWYRNTINAKLRN